MRRLLPLILFCTLIPLLGSADLRWLQDFHDFGSFKEADGPVTAEVKCVNDGPDTTYIRRVKPSCGCTSAGFTPGAILPGDTARVWFTYDPTNRPGEFDKTIKVYIGDENQLKSISIVGRVIGTDESLAPAYPISHGPLRMKRDSVNFGEVFLGKVRQDFISVYNASEDTVTLSFGPMSKALEVTCYNPLVPPGGLATFSVYLNTRHGAEMGHNSLDFPLLANGQEVGTIAVGVDVMPDTSGMTGEQMRMAPFCMTIPPTIDMGILPEKGKRNLEFIIRNDGRSPLQVHRVYSRQEEEALKIKRKPGTLKPGSTGKVSATLNYSLLPKGPFRIPVEIASNDPFHPITAVYVVGIKESE